MDDVYATTPELLVEQYGRGHINDLLRFAEGRDRARLVDAFETWIGGGPLTSDARMLIWSKVNEAGATPPTDPAEIVRIIKEDRAFREGRVLRSTGSSERSSANSTETRRKSVMAEARKRIDENAVITVNTEEGKNPKRVGSKAYDRFALYRDGMTVKEAKAAGVQATDISYDSDPSRNYILLTPNETVAEEGEEEAPKKKKGKAAAAAAA